MMIDTIGARRLIALENAQVFSKPPSYFQK
jgi:hypothetical protein